MRNHIANAKYVVIATRSPAIALLTIGMGVNPAWAGSDQPSGLDSTPIQSEAIFQPVSAAGHPHEPTTMPRTAVRPFIISTTRKIAQDCLPAGSACSNVGQCCFNFTCSNIPPVGSGVIPQTPICQSAIVPECQVDTDCTFPAHCVDHPNPTRLDDQQPLRYCVR
jgi:hypothetical protein